METLSGLSSAEVKTRIAQGFVNKKEKSLTKSYGQIFLGNTFNIFNLFNLLIFGALLAVKSYTNLLFIGVVVLNWATAIYQEIKVKRILERLQLLNQNSYVVVRDGSEKTIRDLDLVKDDLVKLTTGQQIPADMTVVAGFGEVNEALITGEADNLGKKIGDTLYSGSYVVNGIIMAKVEKLGSDSYINKLSQEAKQAKKHQSKLISQLNQIVKFTAYFIVPFGALLIVVGYYLNHISIESVIPSTAGALLGMMPRGLVLLTTLSLMVGIIRLAQKQTLANELSSIETLARVDTLCLDKTGTLTTGEMQVSDILDLQVEPLTEIIGSVLNYNIDNGGTIQALKNLYPTNNLYPGKLLQPFSSDRKYSSVLLENQGVYFFGAPDVLFGDTLPFKLKKHQQGERSLAFAKCLDFDVDKLPECSKLIPLALFILTDKLRDNASEILNYFKEQGVEIKIISGDNPHTISRIAQAVGLDNYNSVVNLSGITEQQLINMTEQHSIFGRANPWQKKIIIETLQKNGHTVAMTGDGVNDILALRQADCSISVLAGSEAARAVSHLILLNNDFSSLPTIINEGRRVINNITSVASLYLIKTFFSFALAGFCMLLVLPFPFEPLDLTILGAFASGIPSFFLALENNKNKINHDFFSTVIAKSLPSSIIIVLSFFLIHYLAVIYIYPTELYSVILVSSTGLIWLIGLLEVCRPFNISRILLWFLMLIGFFGFINISGFYQSFLLWPKSALITIAIIAALTYPLLRILQSLIDYLFSKIKLRKQS